MKKISYFLRCIGGMLFSLGFFYGIFYVHWDSGRNDFWMGRVHEINMVPIFPKLLFIGIILFWIGVFYYED